MRDFDVETESSTIPRGGINYAKLRLEEARIVLLVHKMNDWHD